VRLSWEDDGEWLYVASRRGGGFAVEGHVAAALAVIHRGELQSTPTNSTRAHLRSAVAGCRCVRGGDVAIRRSCLYTQAGHDRDRALAYRGASFRRGVHSSVGAEPLRYVYTGLGRARRR
jgi:hypothetical protein